MYSKSKQFFEKKEIKIFFTIISFFSLVLIIAMINIFNYHQVPITHNRKIYTISQLSNTDILTACEKEYPDTKSIEREGDKIFCFREEKDNNNIMTTTKKLISTNKACDLKHPGKGTWASNGGSHCDDSYLKPKWEN